MKYRRNAIIRAVSSNVYGQGITAALQLSYIFVLLPNWGIEKYGTWATILAAVAYVQLADFGIIAAAMNRMSSGPSQRQLAISAFNHARQVTNTITLFGLIAAGLSTTLAFILKLDWTFILSIIAAGAASLLHLYSGLFDGVFRYKNSYASGTARLETARLFEGTLAIIFAIYGDSILWAAIGMLAGRLAAFVHLLHLTKRMAPEFKWIPDIGISSDSKELLLHGGAWWTSKTYDALTIQGSQILVGTLFGNAESGIFAVYRTFARLSVQISNAVSNALWPVLSKMLFLPQSGRNDNHSVMRDGFLISTLIAIISAVLAYKALPIAISKGLTKHLTFAPDLALASLAYGVMAATAFTTRIYLAAQEKLRPLSAIYLVTPIFAGCALLIYHPTLTSAFALMACAELIVLICSTYLLMAKSQ